MEWLILINVACIWLSWRWAQQCEQWSLGWWLNMFASSLNGVIVLRYLM